MVLLHGCHTSTELNLTEDTTNGKYPKQRAHTWVLAYRRSRRMYSRKLATNAFLRESPDCSAYAYR